MLTYIVNEKHVIKKYSNIGSKMHVLRWMSDMTLINDNAQFQRATQLPPKTVQAKNNLWRLKCDLDN